mmetsp:Transcript_9113/g.26915  ORF Transcript_9113/g.26915 Transcript_9113/m.26915 type:complete len:233 (-) Transcript_9113:3369-4067(-)
MPRYRPRMEPSVPRMWFTYLGRISTRAWASGSEIVLMMKRPWADIRNTSPDLLLVESTRIGSSCEPSSWSRTWSLRPAMSLLSGSRRFAPITVKRRSSEPGDGAYLHPPAGTTYGAVTTWSSTMLSLPTTSCRDSSIAPSSSVSRKAAWTTSGIARATRCDTVVLSENAASEPLDGSAFASSSLITSNSVSSRRARRASTMWIAEACSRGRNSLPTGAMPGAEAAGEEGKGT